MRRLFLTAFLCLAAPSALGQTIHGIIGGLSLGWQYNSTPNEFTVTLGNAYIDGSLAYLTSSATYQLGGTGGTAAILTNGFSLGHDSAYYVYLAPTAQAPYNSSVEVVVSNVKPTLDGHPSTAIDYPNAPNGSSLHEIFLGSVCTDANSVLVPFVRNGDEVIFMPETISGNAVQGAQLYGSWAGLSSDSYAPEFNEAFEGQPLGMGWQQVSLSSSSTAGQSTSVAFGSTTDAPLALPSSASAMIADVTLVNISYYVQSMFILSPILTSVSYNATSHTCSMNDQFQAVGPPAGSSPTDGFYYLPHPASSRVRIQGSGKNPFTVYVGWCDVPSSTVETGNEVLSISYAGYVEDPQHMVNQ
jgi:hypothetical protein